MLDWNVIFIQLTFLNAGVTAQNNTTKEEVMDVPLSHKTLTMIATLSVITVVQVMENNASYQNWVLLISYISVPLR